MTPDEVTVIPVPHLSEMPRGQCLSYAPADEQAAKIWAARHGAKEVYLFIHQHPKPYLSAWIEVKK
jgi:hypothetical protein